MKIFKKILLVVSFLFLFCIPSIAINLDVYEYWLPYNTSHAFEWSAVDGAAGYEIYIFRLEDSKKFLSGKIVFTNKCSIVWKSHGHFIVYVRHFKLVNQIRVFGEWGSSLDPAVGIVDGKPRAWVIYVMQP